MKNLAIVGVILMGSAVGWGQVVIWETEEFVVDANSLQVDPNQMKRLIEQFHEIALDANASEMDPNIAKRMIEALGECKEAEGRILQEDYHAVEGDSPDPEMTGNSAADGRSTKLDSSPAALAGHVMKGRPPKPAPLDANAPSERRLEWVAAMQKWKRKHAAWTKQIEKNWGGKKVHWITTGAFTRMGDSKDANSVTVLALVPMVLQGKGNARIDTVELVLRRCVGPAAALARKMADPNGHIPALDIRGSIETIEMVPAKSSAKRSADANSPAKKPTHRVRITLKQCDLRIPPPDWCNRPRTPVKEDDGLKVGQHGKAVSFYGIKTKATHVVYILDGSGSMAMGGLFDSTARETVTSISELGPSQRLSLLVSIDKKNQVFPHTGFAAATDEGKLNVVKFLERLRPEGQSDLLGGLKDALGRASKAAKANKTSVTLYLVSDGIFSDKKAAAKAVKLIKTARKNNSSIEVHAILTGQALKDSKAAMKAIANTGGGKFKIVPGSD
ncbi:MAG: hypothetical protein ACOCZU_02580 [Planctomycetota bacterium]